MSNLKTGGFRVNDYWPGRLEIPVNTTSDLDLSIFHLISTYIDLLETLRVTATPGLIKLASYRSGVLDMNLPIVIDRLDRDYEKLILRFGHSAICYNIRTLVEIIVSAMTKDLMVESSPINSPNFVTKEMEREIHRFINFDRMNNAMRKDIMISLAGACYLQAYSRSEANMSIDHIFRFFEHISSAELYTENYKDEFFPLLKAVFYIACAYYKVGPEELIALRRLPDFKTAIHITDTTVAAVPMSPAMLNTCADRETPSSTNAIIYIYAIENALRKLPHVKYPELASQLRDI